MTRVVTDRAKEAYPKLYDEWLESVSLDFRQFAVLTLALTIHSYARTFRQLLLQQLAVFRHNKLRYICSTNAISDFARIAPQKLYIQLNGTYDNPGKNGSWALPDWAKVMIIHKGLICQWASCQRYLKLLVAHAPGMPRMFSPPPRVSDPDMHHGTCVTHVPWCMPGLLTSGFLWNRWRGKRSQHSRRMGNPHFYVSGKTPMVRGPG